MEVRRKLPNFEYSFHAIWNKTKRPKARVHLRPQKGANWHSRNKVQGEHHPAELLGYVRQDYVYTRMLLSAGLVGGSYLHRL